MKPRMIDEIFDKVENDMPWATKSLIVAYRDICKNYYECKLEERKSEYGNNSIDGNDKATV